MARFTISQIHDLVHNAFRGDAGGTAYAFDKPEHAGRYIVGGLTRPASFNPELDSQTSVQVTRVYRLFRIVMESAPEAETLGFWIDDRGDAVIDAGDTWHTEYAAMVTARARGEIAIWDRATGSQIIVEEAS